MKSLILFIPVIIISLYTIGCSGSYITKTDILTRQGIPSVEIKYTKSSIVIYKTDEITTWYYFDPDGNLIGIESKVNSE